MTIQNSDLTAAITGDSLQRLDINYSKSFSVDVLNFLIGNTGKIGDGLSSIVRELVLSHIYEKQKKKSGLIGTIYIPPEIRAKNERERYIATIVSELITRGGVSLISALIQYRLISQQQSIIDKNRFNCAKLLCDLVFFSGGCKDGNMSLLPSPLKPVIFNIFQKFDIKFEERKRILENVSKSILLLDVPNNLTDDMKSSLAYLVCNTAKLSGQKINNQNQNIVNLLEILEIGSEREILDCIYENKHKIKHNTKEYSKYINNLVSLVSEVNRRISVPKIKLEKIHSMALNIASYDPYEDMRYRNIKKIQNVGLIGLTLGTATMTGAGSEALFISGLGLCKKFLGGDPQTNQQLEDCFKQIMTHRGESDESQQKVFYQTDSLIKALRKQGYSV